MSTADARELLGRAVGRLPSGLFVCACGRGPRAVAFLASFVQQASLDPPALSVAIESGRPALDALTESGGVFTLSILPAEGGRSIMKRFLGSRSDPFGGLPVVAAPSGGAYLADALAWLDCREIARNPVFRHVLVVGEIVAGDVLRQGDALLHLRRTGFSY